MLKKHNLNNMQLSLDNNSKEHLQYICAVLQIIYLTEFSSGVFCTTVVSEAKVCFYHDTCRPGSGYSKA